MTLLGIGLLLAAATAWIVVPLWRGAVEPPAPPGERAELETRRREILLSLQDLDFELETGKLSPEDHRLMRTRLQSEAVAVLERLEKLSPDETSSGPASAG